MDATRINDGVIVAIKRINLIFHRREFEIACFLTSPEKLQDPRNHVAPILDHYVDETDPNIQFIVMPLLRPFDDPPFYSVAEAIDFMQQTLEV